MTPDLFCRAGEALYGAGWMASMGDALDVAPRTIARWASGYSRIPPNVQFELVEIVKQRGAVLDTLLKELATIGGPDADPAAPATPAPDTTPAKPHRRPA